MKHSISIVGLLLALSVVSAYEGDGHSGGYSEFMKKFFERRGDDNSDDDDDGWRSSGYDGMGDGYSDDDDDGWRYPGYERMGDGYSDDDDDGWRSPGYGQETGDRGAGNRGYRDWSRGDSRSDDDGDDEDDGGFWKMMFSKRSGGSGSRRGGGGMSRRWGSDDEDDEGGFWKRMIGKRQGGYGGSRRGESGMGRRWGQDWDREDEEDDGEGDFMKLMKFFQMITGQKSGDDEDGHEGRGYRDMHGDGGRPGQRFRHMGRRRWGSDDDDDGMKKFWQMLSGQKSGDGSSDRSGYGLSRRGHGPPWGSDEEEEEQEEEEEEEEEEGGNGFMKFLMMSMGLKSGGDGDGRGSGRSDRRPYWRMGSGKPGWGSDDDDDEEEDEEEDGLKKFFQMLSGRKPGRDNGGHGHGNRGYRRWGHDESRPGSDGDEDDDDDKNGFWKMLLGKVGDRQRGGMVRRSRPGGRGWGGHDDDDEEKDGPSQLLKMLMKMGAQSGKSQRGRRGRYDDDGPMKLLKMLFSKDSVDDEEYQRPGRYGMGQKWAPRTQRWDEGMGGGPMKFLQMLMAGGGRGRRMGGRRRWGDRQGRSWMRDDDEGDMGGLMELLKKLMSGGNSGRRPGYGGARMGGRRGWDIEDESWEQLKKPMGRSGGARMFLKRKMSGQRQGQRGSRLGLPGPKSMGPPGSLGKRLIKGIGLVDKPAPKGRGVGKPGYHGSQGRGKASKQGKRGMGSFKEMMMKWVSGLQGKKKPYGPKKAKGCIKQCVTPGKCVSKKDIKNMMMISSKPCQACVRKACKELDASCFGDANMKCKDVCPPIASQKKAEMMACKSCISSCEMSGQEGEDGEEEDWPATTPASVVDEDGVGTEMP